MDSSEWFWQGKWAWSFTKISKTSLASHIFDSLLVQMYIIQTHTFKQKIKGQTMGEYLGCTFFDAYWIHVGPPYCLS
jgi:hypothetical protein